MHIRFVINVLMVVITLPAIANQTTSQCIQRVFESKYTTESAKKLYKYLSKPDNIKDVKSYFEELSFEEVISDTSFLQWYEQNGANVVYNSRFIEQTLLKLEDSGALDFLKDIHRSYYADSFIGFDKKALASLGPNKLYDGLPVDYLSNYYYHSTAGAHDPLKAYKSITSSKDMRPNAFVSRPNYFGEEAFQGEGFYAALEIEGRMGGDIYKSGFIDMAKDYEQYVVKIDIREAKKQNTGFYYDSNRETLVLNNRDVVKLVRYRRMSRERFFDTLLDENLRNPNWLLDFETQNKKELETEYQEKLRSFFNNNFEYYAYKFWLKTENNESIKREVIENLQEHILEPNYNEFIRLTLLDQSARYYIKPKFVAKAGVKSLDEAWAVLQDADSYPAHIHSYFKKYIYENDLLKKNYRLSLSILKIFPDLISGKQLNDFLLSVLESKEDEIFVLFELEGFLKNPKARLLLTDQFYDKLVESKIFYGHNLEGLLQIESLRNKGFITSIIDVNSPPSLDKLIIAYHSNKLFLYPEFDWILTNVISPNITPGVVAFRIISMLAPISHLYTREAGRELVAKTLNVVKKKDINLDFRIEFRNGLLENKHLMEYLKTNFSKLHNAIQKKLK